MAASKALAAFALDDFESRSGSATSILRTIAGLYLRHARPPATRSQVIELATAAGLGQPASQTALSRLADRGLLSTTADGHVLVSDPALAMFARGNRRIFTPRQMDDADPWLLVTFSLPESLRAVRHQLRKHFSQLGGGLVSAGLWIFPAYLQAEVQDVLAALQVRPNTTLFTTGTPDFAGSPTAAARAWWDLDRLAARHRDFIQAAEQLEASSDTPAGSYRAYVRLIDAWRAIPYLDPGLPPMMLPVQWPGGESRRLFTRLSDAHREPAGKHAGRLLGREHRGAGPADLVN